MEGYVQIIITIVGVLGSASIWKYLEARLKAKSAEKQTDLNNNDTVQFRDDLKARVTRLEELLEDSSSKVLTLTAEVHQLRTEVKFLTKENDRLKNL
jgi:cell division protein FtsB